ncbi:hypothetical protein PGH07_06800 [Sulfurovum sp. zt1-1]|uniref:Uncharacterized protein n=1 Tax=Sulfurovum zhangzhouensis TaxID=3019067 RepID=A0ABT7R061_9BACT|nr:hypothetical protein [Sulfurovum zhangzhouensis]MDM5271881.1 hypothetical protein [Sulfurovum zhangzhouensis]
MRMVATRLHTTNDDVKINVDHVREWCEHVLNYCDLLIVVVDKHYFEATKDILYGFGEKIKLFHIDPWISYTQPLNLMVEKALSLGAKELLFQSIEVTISLEDMERLEKHLDGNTLVVGAKLCEGHGDEGETCKLDGWTTPWNTLALWNLSKLALTGFLSVSSGNYENVPGGVEEVVTISLLQRLKPYSMNAKVIHLDSVEWDTEWSSEERQAYHEMKMASKDERAKIQLAALGVDAGDVIFVKDSND